MTGVQTCALPISVGNGMLDKVPVAQVKKWEADAHAYIAANHGEIAQNIQRTGQLDDNTVNSLKLALEDFNKSWSPS